MEEAKGWQVLSSLSHLTNMLLRQLFSLKDRVKVYPLTALPWLEVLFFIWRGSCFPSIFSWEIKQTCLFGPNRLVYLDCMCPTAIHVYNLLSSISSSKREVVPDVVSQENKNTYTSSSTSSPWCKTSLSTNSKIRTPRNSRHRGVYPIKSANTWSHGMELELLFRQRVKVERRWPHVIYKTNLLRLRETQYPMYIEYKERDENFMFLPLP